jgi:D-tyrosyl-tRNA(Tyr) deacylase
MRLVIQRVTGASVTVDQQVVASIGKGLLILCGIGQSDTVDTVKMMAGKTARLRVFEDDAGKMNLDVNAVSGEILVVSQFTLFADCRKGNRPSFMDAAPPEKGEELYLRYVDELSALGIPVKTGIFRAMMKVQLVNDGPVTIMLDSQNIFGREEI